jgi:hypothetical protein
MLTKDSERYYIIFHLARIGVTQSEIIAIYYAIIRSKIYRICILVHWRSGLITALSEDRENEYKKRCMRIIKLYPHLSYSN